MSDVPKPRTKKEAEKVPRCQRHGYGALPYATATCDLIVTFKDTGVVILPVKCGEPMCEGHRLRVGPTSDRCPKHTHMENARRGDDERKDG